MFKINRRKIFGLNIDKFEYNTKNVVSIQEAVFIGKKLIDMTLNILEML